MLFRSHHCASISSSSERVYNVQQMFVQPELLYLGRNTFSETIQNLYHTQGLCCKFQDKIIQHLATDLYWGESQGYPTQSLQQLATVKCAEYGHVHIPNVHVVYTSLCGEQMATHIPSSGVTRVLLLGECLVWQTLQA